MNISKISLKINILLFLILLFSLTFSGTAQYYHFEAKYVRQSEIEAKSLIEFAANEVITPLYFLDLEILDDIATNIKKNPNVNQVYILHSDGRGITDGNREDNDIYNKNLDDEFITQSITKNSYYSQRDDIELKLSQPVMINEKIGYIIIYYSMEELHVVLQDIIIQYVLMSSVVFLIVFILGTIIFKRITTPILQLKQYTEKIKKGYYDNEIALGTHDEIGELADSFNQMQQEIKKRSNYIDALVKQKDEFIHQLGHDLKNPLGPLLNLLPVLEKNEEDANKKEIIAVLHRNAQYMKNLVQKTLELARVNSPNTQLMIESFSIARLLDEVIEKNKMLIMKKNIHIVNNIPKDLVIQADKIRIDELLTNLITNAVKFTQGNGAIIIDVKQNTRDIHVSIQDSGIGLSKEQLPNLFTEFYKADTSRHEFESSGLGLPIAKGIIEKHGGKIWAESEGLGQGSTFHFTLPTEPNFDS